jgi:hypothetical protein
VVGPHTRGMSPTTVVVANRKGGVGKTLTTIYTSRWLVRMGRRVVINDLDPQRGIWDFAEALGRRDGRILKYLGPAPGTPPRWPIQQAVPGSTGTPTWSIEPPASRRPSKSLPVRSVADPPAAKIRPVPARPRRGSAPLPRPRSRRVAAAQDVSGTTRPWPPGGLAPERGLGHGADRSPPARPSREAQPGDHAC